MGDVAVASAPRVSKHRGASEHWFYAAIGIMVILISLVSFLPSIAEPSNRNVPLPITALVATHTFAASVWVLMFLTQTILVATGRTATHRRLGVIGVFVAVVFVVSGFLMNIEEARRGFDLSGDLVRRGSATDPAFILATTNAFGLFAVLVGTAVWYRRRPDVHKRLMVLAILSLTGAPVAHLMGHYPALQAGGGAIGPVSGLVFLSLSAVHDRLAYGRIHRVSLWGGIGAFAWLFMFFTFVMPSAMWRNFTMWLIQ